MASKNVQTFNDVNFDTDVLKSDVPVLVDFTATWCGPCKMLAPIVEKLADEFEGKVRVGKCDIDECPGVAAEIRDPQRSRDGRLEGPEGEPAHGAHEPRQAGSAARRLAPPRKSGRNLF